MPQFLIAVLFILSISVASSAPDRHEAVAEVFASKGIEATLVVANADGKIEHVFNEERSKTRFSPASTFKIFNTLIALDAGIVTSESSPFTWDKQDRGVAVWNQDQTLRSAFKVSCVWCYQEIAREVGAAKYTEALSGSGYGNENIGDQVDFFWLNGDLKISAVEQIAFLKQLLDNSIEYRPEHVEIVKSIMLNDAGSDYKIHAKTGWTGPEHHVGWYVGYVVKGNDTWLFAMNMRMDSAEQAALRKELTIKALRVLALI